MEIFTGEIRKLYIKKLDIKEDSVDAIVGSVIVKKDAPFYCNIVGRLVSFEHHTYLPTREEAEAYINNIVKNQPSALNDATCLYANYNSMEPKRIDRSEFKQLKKSYRKKSRAN